jgi:NADH:ubiquinone oxidoreductase subunit 4 (subunit M)
MRIIINLKININLNFFYLIIWGIILFILIRFFYFDFKIIIANSSLIYINLIIINLIIYFKNNLFSRILILIYHRFISIIIFLIINIFNNIFLNRNIYYIKGYLNNNNLFFFFLFNFIFEFK